MRGWAYGMSQDRDPRPPVHGPDWSLTGFIPASYQLILDPVIEPR